MVLNPHREDRKVVYGVFDFFRDMYFEAGGVDSKKADLERKLKTQEKRKSYLIFSPKMKFLIAVMGVLYLVIQIAIFKETLTEGMFGVIATIILSCVDISCLVLLFLKGKKFEIAAAILMLIFVFGQYLYVLYSIAVN